MLKNRDPALPLVFLDFDGVLHPVKAGDQQFCYLPVFEACMRQCPHMGIVITSTWRLVMELAGLRALFSHDIAQRVLGKTPELLVDLPFARYREIRKYLTKNSLHAPWLAVDNEADLFPPMRNLVLTDSITGFDIAAAEKVLEFYGRCTGG